MWFYRKHMKYRVFPIMIVWYVEPDAMKEMLHSMYTSHALNVDKIDI